MNSIQLNGNGQSPSSKAERLRERAIALRRAGRSRREIKEILGIGSNQTLNEALHGEPPPEWTRRPRAKDDSHARARELREQGLDYEEIAGGVRRFQELGLLWVRDMPRPERLSYEECRKRSAEGARLYWEAERPAREAQREAVRAAAAGQIGVLSKREILIAGAIAYWCEGAKSKPHRRQERVVFINSDPGLIRFFLRFLDEAGVGPLNCGSACTSTRPPTCPARSSSGETSLAPIQPVPPDHPQDSQPADIRKNVGADYHGCLIVKVRRSADLYRRIEGWARARSWPTAEGPNAAGSRCPEIWAGPEPALVVQLPGEDSNLR